MFVLLFVRYESKSRIADQPESEERLLIRDVYREVDRHG
jgi:hypothetical protein